MSTIIEAEPTPEELAFIRSLQHFYCDCIVDGVPSGDWHIERTPEQAARLLRIHVATEVKRETAILRAETAAIRKELTEVTEAFQRECDHDWETVDGRFDSDRGVGGSVYRQCEKCGKIAEADDTEDDPRDGCDDGPRDPYNE